MSLVIRLTSIQWNPARNPSHWCVPKDNTDIHIDGTDKNISSYENLFPISSHKVLTGDERVPVTVHANNLFVTLREIKMFSYIVKLADFLHIFGGFQRRKNLHNYNNFCYLLKKEFMVGCM